MSSLDPPKILQSLLPSPRARTVLWSFVLLAVGLASLLLWLKVETLLQIEIAQKLAILIPPLVLLIVGSFVALYLNNEYFKELENSLKVAPVKIPLKELSEPTLTQNHSGLGDNVKNKTVNNSYSSPTQNTFRVTDNNGIRTTEEVNPQGVVVSVKSHLR